MKLPKGYSNVHDLATRHGYVQLADIVKWSIEPCPHSLGKYPYLGSKKACQRCWEELQQAGGK